PFLKTDRLSDSERAMLMGGACAKAYGWSPKKGWSSILGLSGRGRQRMAVDYSICLGTAGWGVWHSPDAGESWSRHLAPFPLNSRIQALVTHPKEAHTVLAGGDTGLFVSHDGGARWERITTNEANGALPTIWSLTVDPVDPDILFAGTRPAGVYRSRDG